MAGETTTNSTASQIATQWDAELIVENREAAIILPFVDMKGLRQSGTRNMPRLSGTPALQSINNGINEANPQTPVTLSTVSAVASPNARALFVLASWVMLAQSAVNWEQQIPAILGRAAADDMDKAAGVPLAGFSNVAGVTGEVNSLSVLRNAVFKLRTTALAAAGMAYSAFLLNPKQVDDIDAQIQSGVGISLSPLLSDEKLFSLYGRALDAGVLRSRRGDIMGIPVFTSTNVVSDGVDYNGALVLDQLALGGAYNWLATPIRDSQTSNFRLADSHGTSQCYAIEEKDDTKGVTVKSKA